MPFRYTWSPLKLTKGDPKGLRRFGSNFIYWNAIMYITSIELLLSTKTLQVLYPSIVSVMTSGSSCGCLILLHLIRRRQFCHSQCDDVLLLGVLTWALFTCLWTSFLKDLYNPPTSGPPVIILISPMICLELSRSSSLRSSVDLSSVH